MNLEELLEYFKSDKLTQTITQYKASPHFLCDGIFKERVPCLENMAKVKIIKGAGVVLTSISENGEHLLDETSEAYILKIPLPRFALIKHISASEINSLRSLSLQSAQVKSLAGAVGVKIKEAKESFNTTLEYMAAGALFGKVMDGNGNLLFEFGSSNKPKVDLKNDKSKTLFNFIDEIDAKLVSEYGINYKYEVLCGNELFAKLNEQALSEDAFKNNLAKRNEDGTLEILGNKFRRYSAKYKNLKGKEVDFLSSEKGIVVPKDNSSKIFYGRANHTEALNKEPSLMFVSKPEILPRGAGIEFVAEMRAIPACSRPNGLVEIALV